MPIIYARSPYGLNPDVHGYFAMLREYQYLMKDGYIFAFPGHARPWRLYRALRHPRADERSVRTDCVPIQLLLQVLDAEDFYGTIETYQVYEKGAERFPLGNSGVNANFHTPRCGFNSTSPQGVPAPDADRLPRSPRPADRSRP